MTQASKRQRFDDVGSGLSWLRDADEDHFQDGFGPDVNEPNPFGGSFELDAEEDHSHQSMDPPFASPSHSFSSSFHSPISHPLPSSLSVDSFSDLSLPPTSISSSLLAHPTQKPSYFSPEKHSSLSSSPFSSSLASSSHISRNNGSNSNGSNSHEVVNVSDEEEEGRSEEDDDVVEIKAPSSSSSSSPSSLPLPSMPSSSSSSSLPMSSPSLPMSFPPMMNQDLVMDLMHTYNLPYHAIMSNPAILDQLAHANFSQQYGTPPTSHMEVKQKKVKRGAIDMVSVLGAQRPAFHHPSSFPSSSLSAYSPSLDDSHLPSLPPPPAPQDELYGTLLAPLKALGVFKQIIAKGENVLLSHCQLPEDPWAIRVEKDYGDDLVIGFLDRNSGSRLAQLLDSAYGPSIRLEGKISDVTADYKTGSAKVHIYGQAKYKQVIERAFLDAPDLKYISVPSSSPTPSSSSFSSCSSSSSSSSSSCSSSSLSRGGGLNPVREWDEDGYSTNNGDAVVIDLQMEGDVDRLFEQQADVISKLTPQDPPSSVITKLFPYQKQALAWMLQREEKRVAGDDSKIDARGGILADDMGLGKTLQMICLIASTAKSAGFPETPGVGCSTLIVCPLSVMSNWQAQIRTHIKLLRLNVTTYHGPARKQTAEFNQYDIVITTYNIVSTEFKENRERSPLFAHSWRRVILDEAHVIRGKRTQQFQGVCALTSERRWCATGTPIQNVLEDLYALLAFLRVRPYADHEMWTKRIAIPLKHGDPSGLERLQNVLGALCLRRKKNDKDGHGIPIMPALPTKRVRVWGLPFSGAEGALYAKLMASGKAQVESPQFDAGSRRMMHFVLEMLLRLRQCCNHAYLVPKKYLQGFDPHSDENERLQELLKDGSEECSACSRDRASVCTSCCQSLFCSDCSKQAETCPNCGKNLEQYPMIKAKDKGKISDEEISLAKSPFDLSPKLKFFVDKMKEFQNKDPTFKVVVFSQWTSVLTLIQRTLKGEANGYKDFNFKHVRLDGSMTHKARQEAITAFQEDKDVRVFIISLSAGGVGLNLTAANKVFMMDPWWNPATEDQAIDRVHRLGQTREVEVFRLVMKDSLEERIMDLQKKKRDMCSTALSGQFRKGKSRQEIKAERMAELMALFE